LPAPGLATKVLQPGPVDGNTTGTLAGFTWAPCTAVGSHAEAIVGGLPDPLGTEEFDRFRMLTSFDLRDIPTTATISSATLSTWRRYGAPSGATVNAHRVTQQWKEGVSPTTDCVGKGATWYESEPGHKWSTPGGDYDPAVAASATIPSAVAGFDQFSLTSLVQSWVRGDTPNHGVLLRAAGESASTGLITYASDDFSGPALRPKLTVSYQDGSAADDPRVVLSTPTEGARVAGAVTLRASAEDDRRVDLVEFLVNGVSVGSDNTSPFDTTWNTASGVANGSKALTVRATDDAGNIRLSTALLH